MFASVGDVLVYCRPPRSVVGKIRCRVWNIRDQVHLGWVRDERVSRALDLCDKKPDFGGRSFSFCLWTCIVTLLALGHSFWAIGR